MAEISTKPYLIRAIHDWCSDNGYTPYLAVAVDERTLVPREHVKSGEIVLNVSTSATSQLTLGNELITFQARFGGRARELSIPIENVSAIYARESGHGMAFDVPKAMAVVETPDEGDAVQMSAERVVTSFLALAPGLAAEPAAEPDRVGLSGIGKAGDAFQQTPVAGGAGPSPEDAPPDPAPAGDGKSRGGRAKLTRVK